MILLSLALFCQLSSADPPVDADRFVQLIKGIHAPIQDITLACEGELREGEAARSAGLQVEKVLDDYQCRYHYRSDGAALLDLYRRRVGADDRQTHTLLENLDGISSLEAVPDLKRLKSRPARKTPSAAKPARPNPLGRPGCPDYILYLWYFQGLGDAKSMHYEFQGWEEVEGRRCLRVELDLQPGTRPEFRNRLRFWIDLNRGGHPLKIERFKQGQLDLRTEHIKLQQFTDSKGMSIWLPIAGDTESFDWTVPKERRYEMVHYQEPVLVETCRVITDSVVLNRGLGDAELRVASYAPKYGEFAGFKADRKVAAAQRARIDTKEVQRRLDEALADAEEKASRLEASAPGRNAWGLSVSLSVALPIVGVALLCCALIMRWKSS